MPTSFAMMKLVRNGAVWQVGLQNAKALAQYLGLIGTTIRQPLTEYIVSSMCLSPNKRNNL